MASTRLRTFVTIGSCLLVLVAIIHVKQNAFRVSSSSEQQHGTIRTSTPNHVPSAFRFVINATQIVSHETTSPRVKIFKILSEVGLWFQGFSFSLGGHRRNGGISTLPSRPRFETVFDDDFTDDKKAYQVGEINGVHIAFHNPLPTRKLRGVALLIHGCQQTASDWFRLPEHRHIAAHLLHKRLALLAVTSANRVTGCWSTRYPYWENDDVSRILMATKRWIADQNIPPSTPIYGVGISSGATMLSVLSSSNEKPRLVSQALYMSPGNQRALNNATESYPSTLFVHLRTDHYYASPSAIASARKTLLKQNVPLVGELPLSRVHLTPTTLHEREPRISAALSRKIFDTVTRGNHQKIEHAIRLSSDEEIVALWNGYDSRRATMQIMRIVQGLHEVSASSADKVADWLIATTTHGQKKGARWGGLPLQWRHGQNTTKES